ncbi:MAG: putative bifunctional diguanylate cyclase/phosphodiesterase [Limnochordia bacterium]
MMYTVPSAAAQDEMFALVGRGHHDFDDSVYEVYVPIYAGGERAGTIVISKPLHDAQGMGRTISILSVIASAAILVGFLYVMVTNYQYNKKLAALAYHESLTGLPNKAYLEHMLETRLEDAPGGKHAVLMTHCLNLSVINSVYGFDAGDRVVRELVRRLESFVNDRCILFHFATNRFVLFVKGYKGPDNLTALVKRMHSALEEPLDSLGVSTGILAKTGIVELNREHSDPAEVFTQALVALQYAEESDLESYAFFDGEMAERLRRQETIATEMRDFLLHNNTDAMYLVYQPKVDPKFQRILGFEALARMNSPSLGAVSPEEFIKIAERQDMIIPLGYWVLETACLFIRDLIAAGHSDIHVAVNISGIQLLHERFIDQVREILAKTGIREHNVQLEITESVLIEGFSHVYNTLNSLRDAGIKIAIDDFGTGYSSLARMESLPVDSIKIDKSFVDSILAHEGRHPILRDLISMAHNLGLEVVAEGVEHELQRRYLLEWGCDILQGYLFGKPLPKQGAVAKLQESFG